MTKQMTFLEKYKMYRAYGYNHADAMAICIKDERIANGWDQND